MSGPSKWGGWGEGSSLSLCAQQDFVFLASSPNAEGSYLRDFRDACQSGKFVSGQKAFARKNC